MTVSIQGVLPVPIKVNGVNQTKLTMKALTFEESLLAQQDLTEDQFIGLGELCAAMTWSDLSGEDSAVTYEQLATSSSQNAAYLQKLKGDLDKKEREAASEESTPT